MSALRELLARVEAARGPDREIDLAIAMETKTGCFSRSATFERLSDVMRRQDQDGGLYEDKETGLTGARTRFIEVPQVTASIDAAVALVEHLLPGWSWETRKSAHSRTSYSRLWNPEIGPDSEQADTCRSGVPSLALVCALLRALIAKEVGNG